jgi:hypothetical protein
VQVVDMGCYHRGFGKGFDNRPDSHKDYHIAKLEKSVDEFRDLNLNRICLSTRWTQLATNLKSEIEKKSRIRICQ